MICAILSTGSNGYSKISHEQKMQRNLITLLMKCVDCRPTTHKHTRRINKTNLHTNVRPGTKDHSRDAVSTHSSAYGLKTC